MLEDGRNIDVNTGSLTGEAAEQRQAKAPVPGQLTKAVQSAGLAQKNVSNRQATYYEHPMLKQPVWIWSIPAYFYVGGVAGVGASLGAAAQLAAPSSMRSLVVRSRWVATVGGAVSAALLIHDLGRPERFLNMLRVFRVSSPMSMGSWILAVFSPAAGASAILSAGPRFLRPLADFFGFVAGILGLGLSGYTGVLLSQTAVPVWRTSYRITPVLFLASGAASAASCFELFKLNAREERAVEWFGRAAKIVELAAAFALEVEANRIERVGRPLKSGFSGFLWQSAKALTVASAVLSVLPGKSRPRRVFAGILGSVAGLCLRFGMFYAGKASARDPRASFEQQRAGERPSLASPATGLIG
jgi:formate-dependent nitrite reductase membrane component NrfD